MLDSVKSRAKPALMDSYITPNADKDGMAILQNLRTLETQLAVINDMVCVASVVPTQYTNSHSHHIHHTWRERRQRNR